ncbi:MAG: tetratricopeptide repeat protein [Candidatus Obscuribacterales bacterium]|nr:tetratricopeptide repeat protein [Candidatus Obscuribacterales bacterium]
MKQLSSNSRARYGRKKVFARAILRALQAGGYAAKPLTGTACFIAAQLAVAQLAVTQLAVTQPALAQKAFAQPASAQQTSAQQVFAQQAKPKSPAEIVNDAYTLLLNRKPNPAEQQYWHYRLKTLSPFAVSDLYDGLTRLPEYQKRYFGLTPKDQIALMYKTLLRKSVVDPESEKKWLDYYSKSVASTAKEKHGATATSDTVEAIVSTADHVMCVYKAAGLSTQQEWDAVHLAENMAATDKVKATEMYKRIIRTTRIPETHFFLARVQSYYDIKASIETLQGEVDRFPEDALAELRLSYLIHSTGALGISFKRATHALRVSDERAGADTLISSMKERLDKAKHVECLSREMLLSRAAAHDRADQHVFALPELERVLAIGPGDGSVYTQICNSYFNLGQFAKAVEYGLKAEKVFGVSFSILWPRSLSYYELGKYKEAIADFDKVIPLLPEPKFYQTRAKSFEKLGKFKEAIVDYNTLIKTEPRSIKNYVGRGRAYLALSKTKEALADANFAIKLGPRFRDAYKFRAAVYRKLGNKTAAEADQKKYEQMTKLILPKDFD